MGSLRLAGTTGVCMNDRELVTVVTVVVVWLVFTFLVAEKEEER